MLELLAQYSGTQIIVFVIGLAFAVKGGWDLIDYFKSKYNQKFNKDYTTKQKEELLEQHYLACKKQHEESVEMYTSLGQKIDSFVESITSEVNNVNEKLNLLTQSDMHDIKSWIVEKHHKYMRKGWVDDFTMDTIEKRYSDYVAENGNSYVGGLVTELRGLPHTSPEEEKE